MARNLTPYEEIAQGASESYDLLSEQLRGVTEERKALLAKRAGEIEQTKVLRETAQAGLNKRSKTNKYLDIIRTLAEGAGQAIDMSSGDPRRRRASLRNLPNVGQGVRDDRTRRQEARRTKFNTEMASIQDQAGLNQQRFETQQGALASRTANIKTGASIREAKAKTNIAALKAGAPPTYKPPTQTEIDRENKVTYYKGRKAFLEANPEATVNDYKRYMEINHYDIFKSMGYPDTPDSTEKLNKEIEAEYKRLSDSEHYADKKPEELYGMATNNVLARAKLRGGVKPSGDILASGVSDFTPTARLTEEQQEILDIIAGRKGISQFGESGIR